MIGQILDRHLRAVLDGAPDGILVEGSGRIAYINPAYAAMLGYPSVTELSDATVDDIAYAEDLEQLAWFGQCRRLGRPAPTRYSFRANGRRGTIVTFDASVSTTQAAGEFLITTIVRAMADKPEPAQFVVPGLSRLSPRELEVIHHLLDGRRSKDIAALLSVSEKTIGTHRCRAFHKLGLRSDLDLFRLAVQVGAI